MSSLRFTGTPAVIVALVVVCGSPAEAVTRVYVQNNTSMAFSVRATQTGAPLEAEHWRLVTTSVTPGQRAEVLWFSRNDGISNDETFVFTTTLAFSSSQILLRQKLEGTTFSSHMWQSLTGPGLNHTWYDDRATHSAAMRVAGRSLQAEYRAFFAGTDDNIEYVLREAPTVPAAASQQLNVLAYNIYMRPIALFRNGQMIRAGLLPSQLRGYDVLVFSEAFDDDVRTRLLGGLRTEYPHATRILGSDRGVEQDGGVIIVSRWPIEAQDQRLYRDVCAGSDCQADKGVLYARINKRARRYHVFGSHTQAWPTAEGARVRARQFDIIRAFITSKAIPRTEAVVIAGDLNVDKIRHVDEYRDMLRRLNAAQPRQVGHRYSFDPDTNDLAEEGPSEYLDYVLFSRRHLNAVSGLNEVRTIRSAERWREFFWEGYFWDLSDHHAVYGRLEF